jgi:biopolymer transport protein TolR
MMQSKYLRHYKERKQFNVVHDINVTPFIDIMLVLLVVFMISAPLLVSGVNVNLPHSDVAAPIDVEDPFTITLTKSEKIVFEDKEIKLNQISEFIKENVLSVNRVIFLRGDQGLKYGFVMRVISKINEAGYKKVSLVTENKNEN